MDAADRVLVPPGHDDYWLRRIWLSAEEEQGYYYGFSMLDYSMERHKKSTSESIAFVAAHKGLAIGNGLVFYLFHLLPLIGWILAPAYAVVAATLSIYPLKKEALEKIKNNNG